MDGLFAGASGGTFSTVLIGALLWGLLGGVSHCIGMCGIFVLSAGPMDEPNFAKRAGRQVGFQLGRMVSLTVIGAIAGALGSLARLASHVERWQSGISVGVGVLLILLALGYAGIIPRFKVPEPDMMGAGDGFGRKVFVAALRHKSWYQPISLGALVGLLPCGLTYTIAIAAASTLSPLRGALVLFVFWLGTVPGLVALGLAGHLFRRTLQSASFRLGMTRVGAIVMLVMGVALIWRAWPYLS